jgi:hypothetical protein
MRYCTETVEASVFGRLGPAARFLAVVCAILLVTAVSAVAQCGESHMLIQDRL